MKSNTLRIIILLAALSVIGILVTQIFWVRKAFDIEDKQFNMNVNVALREVARHLYTMNNAPVPLLNPVAQLSDNYFAVMINGNIDTRTLEALLKGEFEKRGIQSDFEYGIYDCQTDRMAYGDYVHLDKGFKLSNPVGELPKWENQPYYFGVAFPNKDTTLLSQMGIWIFSSAVLIVVVAFFVFASWVILQQKRLSEVQKDFINNMTHEFKTPISTIFISANVLRKSNIIDNPARLANYANIIHDEATRLKDQVERVLQMATIEEDKIRLSVQSLNLHEIITKTVDNIDAILKENEGIITLHLDAKQCILHGDSLHLTNIIYNLLDNAIKYCTTEPQINIKTYNKNEHFVLEIQDNGIGIANYHTRKVWDKFYRVPTGNIHDVKGFGLGLNYVKVVVAAHKGTVTLTSELHKGTTIFVKLPIT